MGRRCRLDIHQTISVDYIYYSPSRTNIHFWCFPSYNNNFQKQIFHYKKILFQSFFLNIAHFINVLFVVSL